MTQTASEFVDRIQEAYDAGRYADAYSLLDGDCDGIAWSEFSKADHRRLNSLADKLERQHQDAADRDRYESHERIHSVPDLHKAVAHAIDIQDVSIIQFAAQTAEGWLIPEDERDALVKMLQGIETLLENAIA